MKWYQRTLQLLNKLAALNKDELFKVIQTTSPKIGMRNKYDNF